MNCVLQVEGMLIFCINKVLSGYRQSYKSLFPKIWLGLASLVYTLDNRWHIWKKKIKAVNKQTCFWKTFPSKANKAFNFGFEFCSLWNVKNRKMIEENFGLLDPKYIFWRETYNFFIVPLAGKLTFRSL